MQDVVIVEALRTPIGRFQGALSSVPATELGSIVTRELLRRSGIDPNCVDGIIMGQVLTAGCGQNPARQTALNSGLPWDVSATTINKVCGSGLEAVSMAAQSIMCGNADVMIAGGQENMSLAPYVMPQSRSGMRLGHGQVIDSLIQDGLWDAFEHYHMGLTAENLAEEYNISRKAQDQFAAHSQQKAAAAIAAGLFADEIVPVRLSGRKGEYTVSQDEQPRGDVDVDSLAQLRPAFKENGSVTAGNASSLNDGAAAVLLMRADKAREYQLPILARICAYASAGVNPSVMGIAPVNATRRCLATAGWNMDDVDLIEANEAFAAQALAVGKNLEWDSGKVNVNGGAIALGHPIGASGCRILVSLIHEMQRRNAFKGLATLCIGGGQGVAMALGRHPGE